MGKTSIIIQREFTQRVRKRSFILTTILTPLLFVGLLFAPALIMSADTSKEKTILVADETGWIGGELTDAPKVRFLATEGNPEELKAERQSGIFGFLHIPADIVEHPDGLKLYSYTTSTVDLEAFIARKVRERIEERKLAQYDIEDLPAILEKIHTPVRVTAYRLGEEGGERASSSELSFGISFVLGFLIYMFVFMYGGMVMQGVVEEKSSKVLEIMVSSVKPFQLMLGKITGIALVALTQFMIWIVLMVVFGSVVTVLMGPESLTAAAEQSAMGMDMSAVGMPEPGSAAVVSTLADLSYLGTVVGGFLIFFIGGYLLYAAMFAAVGSAVDSTSDSQQLQLPITVPLLLAIFILMNVVKDPDGVIAFWFSLIPFTSPVIMVARLPFGVPGWQFALSAVLLYVTFIGMVWAAGKIYRIGIFMSGRKPSLGEIVKWVRYKG